MIKIIFFTHNKYKKYIQCRGAMHRVSCYALQILFGVGVNVICLRETRSIASPDDPS